MTYVVNNQEDNLVKKIVAAWRGEDEVEEESSEAEYKVPACLAGCVPTDDEQGAKNVSNNTQRVTPFNL